MIQNKNQTQDTPPHLQELTGSPSSTSVSDVAKGGKPENINEEIIREAETIHDRRYEGKEGGADCSEIQEAYAKLFESLATIARM